MLEVSNLKVKYGDVVAVHDASFVVKEREIVALVGSNGSGKSTVVKAISGLICPDYGKISFEREDTISLSSHEIVERGLIQVPEGRKVFSNLIVEENLRLGSYSRKARGKREETKEMVYALFPRLFERRNQKAGSLSGGEQQMLALGRGLMSIPKLLMLDEPSLGLAPLVVLQLFEIIERINKMGTTILLIEQNTVSALKSCNRGYVIENGFVTLTGTGVHLLNDTHVMQAYLGL